MKLFRLGLFISLIISLLVITVPAAARVESGEEYVTDRIIVKYREGLGSDNPGAPHRKYGDTLESEIPQLGVKVLKVPPGQVKQKLVSYRADKDVIYAEADYIMKAIGTPSDTYFSNEWGLTKIEAPQAWNTTQGSSAVKIAILDTGIDLNHADLASKITASRNFTGSLTTDDKYGHGTHVAGIAAAVTNNGLGVAGVGYNCSLMNVKVLDDAGSGYNSWIASGIIWAADNGARVINMSLGGGGSSTTLQNAINYAWGKGVVVVAAAGNEGTSLPSYPAYYSNCIAVAATGQSDTRASFSNYGGWVDVAAPGVNIYSTLPNHTNAMGANYGSLSGTSMATPFVAGLAGLIWATPYGTSATSVRNRIESTADGVPGTGSYWKYGRINASDAVGSIASPPPTTTPPVTTVTQPAVTVTTPNGGQAWAAGSTHTITWTSSGLTGYVKIELLKGSTVVRTITTGTLSSTGSRSWTISSTQAPGTDYRIRITSTSNTSVTDTSNAYFTITGITPPATTTIVPPTTTSTPPPTTTTAPPSSGKLHVKSISMSLVPYTVGGLSYVRATATITVVNESGALITGARVYGVWSGATTDSDNGLTASTGKVSLSSNLIRRVTGQRFTFTITNIEMEGLSYDAGANVVTSASIVVS